MVDGKVAHGGLVDRFKGMVTFYHIAKILNSSPNSVSVMFAKINKESKTRRGKDGSKTI